MYVPRDLRLIFSVPNVIPWQEDDVHQFSGDCICMQMMCCLDVHRLILHMHRPCPECVDRFFLYLLPILVLVLNSGSKQVLFVHRDSWVSCTLPEVLKLCSRSSEHPVIEFYLKELHFFLFSCPSYQSNFFYLCDLLTQLEFSFINR